ncbi:MAG TPA: lysophospholipid acyltransferase family protein [Chitinophagaceae bacterium]|nr:lysophospholipid acyltransferase family protein [Chitinophagaceae bacterium]
MRAVYSLYCVLTFIVLFLLFFPFFLILFLFKNRGEKGIWYLIKAWGYLWFFMIGQRLERINWKDKYQEKTPFVCIANHQSYLDTAMIFVALPFISAPLAKYELTKIPLFGLLYRKMAILIDRKNVESKREGYENLYKTLKIGKKSVFIFPEGTFNESDDALLPFYNGAFRIAIECQKPILPILFLDTKNRFHYKNFWKWSPGKTRAVFLPLYYPPEDLSMLESWKEMIRKDMEKQLLSYP